METQVSKQPKKINQARCAINQARDLSVRALLSKGLSQREAADILGIARSTVRAIQAKIPAQEGYPDPRTVQRDAMALKVLDRVMAVGAKMPPRKIRASDAVQAVKAYAGIAWPQIDPSKSGTSINFTEVHIHEARLTGPASYTTPCVELSQETTDNIDPQPYQLLAAPGSVG